MQFLELLLPCSIFTVYATNWFNYIVENYYYRLKFDRLLICLNFSNYYKASSFSKFLQDLMSFRRTTSGKSNTWRTLEHASNQESFHYDFLRTFQIRLICHVISGFLNFCICQVCWCILQKEFVKIVRIQQRKTIKSVFVCFIAMY